MALTMRPLRSLYVLPVLFLLAACGGSPSSDGPQVEGDPVGVVGAHEHGVARLALAVEGAEIFVSLEAPGDAVFGFEREPETDEEWALVAERISGLEAGLASSFEIVEGLACSASGPVQITGAPERGAAASGAEAVSYTHLRAHET